MEALILIQFSISSWLTMPLSMIAYEIQLNQISIDVIVTFKGFSIINVNLTITDFQGHLSRSNVMKIKRSLPSYLKKISD